MASKLVIPKLRDTFLYDRKINWFPGHMAKGLRIIQEKLNSIDIIVEARDARIPVSSINPRFEEVVGKKERLVVYNKADLADPKTQKPITEAIKKYHGHKVLFTNANQDMNVKKIIKMAAEKSKKNPLEFPFVNVMIVGMPNVGKSSLINSMRRVGLNKGKAARTGPMPGVTRKVIGTVKVWDDPPVYLFDTPGVMIPHIPDPLTSLKVALTGGIRDHIADEEIMADYLLYQLNRFGNLSYVDMFKMSEPTDDISVVLPAVAKRIGALHKGAEPDLTAGARYFIKQYRDGKFGRYTLDDCSPSALDRFFTEPSIFKVEKSRHQLKKEAFAEKMAKIMNRREIRRKKMAGES
ncbi:P-loop containing nucleoside triphosphate hydrolase protein [Basidiobolus meristosporus CBS 931.73]|uniref:p-loop containing nucleoside triphosphate hydrolase protein n=1 Tax=Basidiobolus meristosporus CBS 931.73 TaxID=1314790 RepID=A0A1Y1XYK2_9FUNG|nr:P-loop containing nucleoside triphosphate hydrolase protein [Basidiobolus meristosporus CBS 931.73]|eukprot:ORX90837.1 P-loop containing nucleoside triphosphate hydrolase protein [Basidiobolus meristosporus CBS 931.73]